MPFQNMLLQNRLLQNRLLQNRPLQNRPLARLFLLLILGSNSLCGCVTTSRQESGADDREGRNNKTLAEESNRKESPRLKVDGSEPVAYFKIEIGREMDVPMGTNLPPRRNRNGAFRPHTWFLDENLEQLWHRRVRPQANRLLKSSGYDVPVEDNPLFGKDKTGHARFQLGAVLKDIELETRMLIKGGVTGTCWVSLQWQVYDTTLQTVVYKKVHEGFAEEGGILAIKLMTDALIDSLGGVLGDKKFARALKLDDDNKAFKKGERKRRKKKVSALSVGSCSKAPRKLPRDVERALDAVVIIRAGLGHGSGAFISDDGHILTAAHVVGANKKVLVITRAGDEVVGTLLRRDDRQDVAILKIDQKSPACLELDRKPLAVGTEVYAIGTPFDEKLAHTVSRGVVSAYRDEHGLRFLQSDVTVSPGNSGGPIVAPSGRIAGVASRKIVLLGFEGLSFHVPADTAIDELGLRFGSEMAAGGD